MNDVFGKRACSSDRCDDLGICVRICVLSGAGTSIWTVVFGLICACALGDPHT
jgi:hypothetical protein